MVSRSKALSKLLPFPSRITINRLHNEMRGGAPLPSGKGPARTALLLFVLAQHKVVIEWAAEQPTEITTTVIDLDKNWSLCCNRCTQHSWLSRVTRRMTLSPTRGSIRWRHGGDCRSVVIRQQEEGNETFCARSSPGRCSLLELEAGIERWESYVSLREEDG